MNRRSFLTAAVLGTAGVAATGVLPGSWAGANTTVCSAMPAGPSLWIADAEPSVALAVHHLANLAGISNIRVFGSKPFALRWMLGTRPDLIVSDFLDPEMSGKEFVGSVRALSPRTRIILFSAVLDGLEAWVGLAGRNVPAPDVVIQKPDAAGLLRVLRGVCV